jgi:hypothetical protein
MSMRRGYSLMLWSARGREYADAMAQRYGVAGLFDVILAKPGYIVDDLGWDWIKYTQVIRSFTSSGVVVNMFKPFQIGTIQTHE